MANLTAIAKDLAPTGTLRASINIGNPILAQGTLDVPTGPTVDISHEVARRLGLPLQLIAFNAARKSFEAMNEGRADICYLAIEPVRAAEVSFTAPYVLIEGVFAVPVDSPIKTVEDADKPGVRIGVNEGSAYHLYLSRTLKHATCVFGDGDGQDVFRANKLEAAAGVRGPVLAYVAKNPDLRVIPERFMVIQQAVGIKKGKSPETVQWLSDLVGELRASGFVAQALERAGQDPALAAPPDATS
ncbi:extracellular solute-binding protein family 3 [Dacryopinax primogenitus]|uniref:Extracellular solute-binding protein family 3 n=1 Tax=Dacryopinax primogenitus (strain DJM 731) TaxID=1858805 RepID=M5FQ20_DACPD|nr:extracellular solute-binding protein family 3 [Dacryopinax primogenitus]EJT97478.1 extracellular solute-binding protein family 3 [Dacryopinax primogenitus]